MLHSKGAQTDDTRWWPAGAVSKEEMVGMRSSHDVSNQQSILIAHCKCKGIRLLRDRAHLGRLSFGNVNMCLHAIWLCSDRCLCVPKRVAMPQCCQAGQHKRAALSAAARLLPSPMRALRCCTTSMRRRKGRSCWVLVKYIGSHPHAAI